MQPALLGTPTLVTVITFCPLSNPEAGGGIEIVGMDTHLTVSYGSGQSSLNRPKLEGVEAPSLP